MMNLGIIAASHDRAGIKHVMDLGLGYAEFDVNADDIAYVTGNVFRTIQTSLPPSITSSR